MPAEFINLNLPPFLRYKADNMLTSMLIPSQLSAAAQSKYFEKVCVDDLNPLLERGIRPCATYGGTVKVKVFGQCLDLKGREKFLNQISVNGYMGCSHCCVRYPTGVASSGPRYAVSRTHLSMAHPLRQRKHHQYEYPAPEHEGKNPDQTPTQLTLQQNLNR